MYMHMYMCMHACMHVCSMYVYVCMYIDIYVCMYVCIITVARDTRIKELFGSIRTRSTKQNPRPEQNELNLMQVCDSFRLLMEIFITQYYCII